MKGIKILLGIALTAVAVVGCAPKQTAVWETVDDGRAVATSVPRYDVVLSAPADTVLAETFSSTGSQVYTQSQGDYTIAVEVLQADSVQTMLETLTGLDPALLTVMTTWQGNMPRYDLAWTCAGETGLLVCRGAVIDDGSHFYAVTAAIPEALTAEYGGTVETCLAGLTLTENTDGEFTAP